VFIREGRKSTLCDEEPEKWEAGEIYVQELSGSSGQRHFPVPETGGRHVDAPADNSNGGVVANEVKTYNKWITVDGKAKLNEVPLSDKIKQQIQKDVWLRDNVAGYDPRWLFLDAPPSIELSKYLTDRNIIHVIYK